jgi:hypothetical protein
MRRHANYDRAYTVTHFCHWLLSNLLRIPWGDADTYLRDYLGGRSDAALPASAAGFVERYAQVAAIMGEFYGQLQTVSKLTPYPAEELERALNE